MVATDTTISGSAGRISSASSRPAVSANATPKSTQMSSAMVEIVVERDERERRRSGSPPWSCRYDRRPTWVYTEHMSPAEHLSEALVRQMLGVAVEEARHGQSQGGIPIGAALFHEDGSLLGRGHNRRVQDGRPLHARRDGSLPGGRSSAALRRLRHGHDLVALLVLQRTAAPVRDRHGRDRRGHQLRRRSRLGGPSTAVGSSCSTTPNASTCWPASSHGTPNSGTRTSGCDRWPGRPAEVQSGGPKSRSPASPSPGTM